VIAENDGMVDMRKVSSMGLSLTDTMMVRVDR
jgi:hypothetical protein